MQHAGIKPGAEYFGVRVLEPHHDATPGTPLYELQQLGGWESRDMVRRYAHLAPEQLARAAANIVPIATKMATPEAIKGSA